MDPSARAAARPATYDDVRNAPDDRIAEILDGELVLSPRPAPPHATLTFALGTHVGAGYGRAGGGRPGAPGGWRILFEPELHLGGHVLVPDLAGWRRERMPTLPRGAAFTVVPDWVCEVVSPQSAGRDRVRKAARYAELGVAYLWLVDPDQQTLEAFRLGAEGHWVRVAAFQGPEKANAPPFEALELDLAGWWADIAPEPGPESAPPAAP